MQMRCIRELLEYGYQKEEFGFLLKNVYDEMQAEEILWAVKRDILNVEQIQRYADPEFSSLKMRQIYWDLETGFTEEQVDSYVYGSSTIEEMYQRRKALLNSLSNKERDR